MVGEIKRVENPPAVSYVRRMKSAIRLLLACGVLLATLLTSPAAQKSYSIAVIPKGTTHEFWKCIHAGAIKAQRELQSQGTKVEIIWKGPLREDDRDQQIQVVENFMTRRVSGIVLAPLDSRALVKPVVNAVASGIPVVIMDSDLNSDKQVSFVATDNYKGGALGAERLATLLGGKGNVILLRYAVGSASTEQREAGFLEEIARHPGIELLSSDRHGGPDESKAIEVGENLAQTYGDRIDGVFCSNESCTSGMLTALARDPRGLASKVKVVGFDSSDRIVTALKEGRLAATVLQDPVAMGEKAVRAMHAKLTGKPVDARVQTGETLVTSQTVDDPAMRRLLFPLAD